MLMRMLKSIHSLNAVMAVAGAAVLAAVAAQAAPLRAQGTGTLTVTGALKQAEQSGYSSRIARAGAAAAQAESRTALKGVLPAVRLESGVVRSNDPLAAFGSIMRQRSVTPTAFDPNSLNYPVPRTNMTTGVVLEAPIFNADAWAGKAASGHAADAARASADWQSVNTGLDVMRAYYGVVLAREQVTALSAATAAARSHVRVAESAADNGLVTRSDALLAAVRAGEIETHLAAARGNAATARLTLALLLGAAGDTAAALPDVVPSPAAIGAGSQGSTLLADAYMRRNSERADLDAARAGVAAADAAVRAATRTFIPRVNGFARYDWHDQDSPIGRDGMWTIGVMASWSPFTGGAEIAQRNVAVANARAAHAMQDAAMARANLEIQAAEIAVETARHALATAGKAVAQSEEAHRVVGRKYEGGLATVSELLDAQAIAIATKLSEAKARYDLVIAHAELARANGIPLNTIAAALDAAQRN